MEEHISFYVHHTMLHIPKTEYFINSNSYKYRILAIPLYTKADTIFGILLLELPSPQKTLPLIHHVDSARRGNFIIRFHGIHRNWHLHLNRHTINDHELWSIFNQSHLRTKTRVDSQSSMIIKSQWTPKSPEYFINQTPASLFNQTS